MNTDGDKRAKRGTYKHIHRDTHTICSDDHNGITKKLKLATMIMIIIIIHL